MFNDNFVDDTYSKSMLFSSFKFNFKFSFAPQTNIKHELFALQGVTILTSRHNHSRYFLVRTFFMTYLFLEKDVFVLSRVQDKVGASIFSGPIFNYSFQQCSQQRGSLNFFSSPQCKYTNFIYLKSKKPIRILILFTYLFLYGNFNLRIASL